MIKLSEYIKGEPLNFRDEMRDHRAGESYMTLYAIDKENKQVGSITYSIYNDDISIQYIKTIPTERRKGIATAMARELQRLHPKSEIVWGGTTDDGTKFLGQLPRTFTKNNRYEEIVTRLKVLNKKKEVLANIYKKWHDLYDKDKEEAEEMRPRINQYNNLYTRVDDEIFKLEQELIRLKSGEWKVTAND